MKKTIKRWAVFDQKGRISKSVSLISRIDAIRKFQNDMPCFVDWIKWKEQGYRIKRITITWEE